MNCRSLLILLTLLMHGISVGLAQESLEERNYNKIVAGRISDEGAYGAVPWLDLADGYGAYLVIEADSATGNELAGLLYDVIDEAVTQS